MSSLLDKVLAGAVPSRLINSLMDESLVDTVSVEEAITSSVDDIHDMVDSSVNNLWTSLQLLKQKLIGEQRATISDSIDLLHQLVKKVESIK